MPLATAKRGNKWVNKLTINALTLTTKEQNFP